MDLSDNKIGDWVWVSWSHSSPLINGIIVEVNANNGNRVLWENGFCCWHRVGFPQGIPFDIQKAYEKSARLDVPMYRIDNLTFIELCAKLKGNEISLAL